ncbi:hypothetical protein ACLOJK_023056 [Asimina triloba]
MERGSQAYATHVPAHVLAVSWKVGVVDGREMPWDPAGSGGSVDGRRGRGGRMSGCCPMVRWVKGASFAGRDLEEILSPAIAALGRWMEEANRSCS